MAASRKRQCRVQRHAAWMGSSLVCAVAAVAALASRRQSEGEARHSDSGGHRRGLWASGEARISVRAAATVSTARSWWWWGNLDPSTTYEMSSRAFGSVR